jgi:hypothetical protein
MNLGMNVMEKLALVQRNQQQIDLLTNNNNQLISSIVTESAMGNLLNIPGLPPQIGNLLRAAMNGQMPMPFPSNGAAPHPALLLGAGEEPKRRGRKPGSKNATTTAAAVTRKPGTRPPTGFYDKLMIDFAQQRGGRFVIQDFRKAHEGKKKNGIPETFFHTTLYSKASRMTTDGVFKKVSDGVYELNPAAAASAAV